MCCVAHIQCATGRATRDATSCKKKETSDLSERAVHRGASTSGAYLTQQLVSLSKELQINSELA